MSGYGYGRHNYNRGRHGRQIDKALRNGETKESKTNTRVTFDGRDERIRTFEGSRHVMTGHLSFWHWNSRVLEVDFDKDMVTDFGFDGYSVSTSANINAWLEHLIKTGFLGMQSLQPGIRPPKWTATISTRRMNETHRDRLFAKFCAGVPWVKRVDGALWFHGPSYDDQMAIVGENLIDDICANNNWRWFTASWMNGLWTKHFISNETEARWRKRRAR